MTSGWRRTSRTCSTCPRAERCRSSRSTCPTNSGTCATGCMGSPRTWCVRPPPSGTGARRRRGRVIAEAAKIGLYGFEFLANIWAHPTGLTLCLASEELFWGDAGIGLSNMGTSLAVAAIYEAGTQEHCWSWCRNASALPTSLRRRPSATPSRRPARTSAIRTRATYDETRDEWVLTGQKAYATNGCIAAVRVVTATVDPSLGSRGPWSVRGAARHAGPVRWLEAGEAGPARLAHRRRVPGRVAGARAVPARRPGRTGPTAGSRQVGAVGNVPGRNAYLRALPADRGASGGGVRAGGYSSCRS